MNRAIWLSAYASFMCAAATIKPLLAAEQCASDTDIQFICGLSAVEDLVPIEGSDWLIGSGFGGTANPGALYAVDTRSRDWRRIYPTEKVPVEPDTAQYAACPGPLVGGQISAHGLAISRLKDNEFTLLVVNHLGRESVEVFHVRTDSGAPELAWVGCVLMPDDVFANAVGVLPDGGFVVTKFFDRRTPVPPAALFSGATTGGLLEWRPGGVVAEMPDTEFAGANGIAVSADGKTIFVAATGSLQLFRLERTTKGFRRSDVPLGFSPDNVHWAPDGNLIVAGQRVHVGSGEAPKFEGWIVVKVDPRTLAVLPMIAGSISSPLQGVSVAVEYANKLWIGSYSADRIGYTKWSTDTK